MMTNILVSIAMAPFEPQEDREWAVIGGCVKKYRFTPPVSRSNTTQCSGELVGKDAGHLRTGNQYCVPRRPNKRDVRFAITGK